MNACHEDSTKNCSDLLQETIKFEEFLKVYGTDRNDKVAYRKAEIDFQEWSDNRSSQYRSGGDPSTSLIFYVRTVIETLSRGSFNEKELRAEVIDIFHRYGVKHTGRGTISGLMNIDISVICNILHSQSIIEIDTSNSSSDAPSSSSSHLLHSHTTRHRTQSGLEKFREKLLSLFNHIHQSSPPIKRRRSGKLSKLLLDKSTVHMNGTMNKSPSSDPTIDAIQLNWINTHDKQLSIMSTIDGNTDNCQLKTPPTSPSSSSIKSSTSPSPRGSSKRKSVEYINETDKLIQEYIPFIDKEIQELIHGVIEKDTSVKDMMSVSDLYPSTLSDTDRLFIDISQRYKSQLSQYLYQSIVKACKSMKQNTTTTQPSTTSSSSSSSSSSTNADTMNNNMKNGILESTTMNIHNTANEIKQHDSNSDVMSLSNPHTEESTSHLAISSSSSSSSSSCSSSVHEDDEEDEDDDDEAVEPSSSGNHHISSVVAEAYKVSKILLPELTKSLQLSTLPHIDSSDGHEHHTDESIISNEHILPNQDTSSIDNDSLTSDIKIEQSLPHSTTTNTRGPRRSSLRKWKLCDNIAYLLDIEHKLQAYAKACYNEALEYEREEVLLRQLCGIFEIPVHSEAYSIGTSYLNQKPIHTRGELSVASHKGSNILNASSNTSSNVTISQVTTKKDKKSIIAGVSSNCSNSMKSRHMYRQGATLSAIELWEKGRLNYIKSIIRKKGLYHHLPYAHTNEMISLYGQSYPIPHPSTIQIKKDIMTTGAVPIQNKTPRKYSIGGTSNTYSNTNNTQEKEKMTLTQATTYAYNKRYNAPCPINYVDTYYKSIDMKGNIHTSTITTTNTTSTSSSSSSSSANVTSNNLPTAIATTTMSNSTQNHSSSSINTQNMNNDISVVYPDLVLKTFHIPWKSMAHEFVTLDYNTYQRTSNNATSITALTTSAMNGYTSARTPRLTSTTPSFSRANSICSEPTIHSFSRQNSINNMISSAYTTYDMYPTVTEISATSDGKIDAEDDYLTMKYDSGPYHSELVDVSSTSVEVSTTNVTNALTHTNLIRQNTDSSSTHLHTHNVLSIDTSIPMIDTEHHTRHPGINTSTSTQSMNSAKSSPPGTGYFLTLPSSLDIPLKNNTSDIKPLSLSEAENNPIVLAPRVTEIIPITKYNYQIWTPTPIDVQVSSSESNFMNTNKNDILSATISVQYPIDLDTPISTTQHIDSFKVGAKNDIHMFFMEQDDTELTTNELIATSSSGIHAIITDRKDGSNNISTPVMIPHNTLEVDDSGESDEDISDEAILNRHNHVLFTMREKWSKLQTLRKQLKEQQTIVHASSTPRPHTHTSHHGALKLSPNKMNSSHTTTIPSTSLKSSKRDIMSTNGVNTSVSVTRSTSSINTPRGRGAKASVKSSTGKTSSNNTTSITNPLKSLKPSSSMNGAATIGTKSDSAVVMSFPLKRGRGRPPKLHSHVTNSTTTTNTTTSVSSKSNKSKLNGVEESTNKKLDVNNKELNDINNTFHHAVSEDNDVEKSSSSVMNTTIHRPIDSHTTYNTHISHLHLHRDDHKIEEDTDSAIDKHDDDDDDKHDDDSSKSSNNSDNTESNLIQEKNNVYKNIKHKNKRNHTRMNISPSNVNDELSQQNICDTTLIKSKSTPKRLKLDLTTPTPTTSSVVLANNIHMIAEKMEHITNSNKNGSDTKNGTTTTANIYFMNHM